MVVGVPTSFVKLKLRPISAATPDLGRSIADDWWVLSAKRRSRQKQSLPTSAPRSSSHADFATSNALRMSA